MANIIDKKWPLWAIVLVLTGTIGLTWTFVNKSQQKQRSQASKTQYSEMLDESPELTAAEHIDSLLDQAQKGKAEMSEQLRPLQNARLGADISSLASGDKKPPVLAEVVYGPNWGQKVAEYRKKMMVVKAITLTSLAILATGILIIVAFLIKWSAGIILKFRNKTSHEHDDTISQTAKTIEPEDAKTDTVSKKKNKKTPIAKPQIADKKQGYAGDNTGYFTKNTIQDTGADKDALEEILQTQDSAADGHGVQFSQTASSDQIATMIAPEPVNDSLVTLTQEVSAIREFAAQQQDRVRQLQEGYDWTIVKRFCLRIIRCVDNLTDRIDKLAAHQEETEYLEDVRDELVFALESSGVEQFDIEVDTDYKGMEKYAEALRQKEMTSQTSLAGKIAKVIKPGYQYILNEDDVKIVRPAQIVLYG